ncbi:hypothetical protein ACFUIT_34690 [Streptomyces sp. NPDC057239]|uniref:hypothetical protein n=1 Tax=Streptomyces sp. NPDC057239 TaxID=3346061 RepID=UPI0036384DBE
MVRIEGLADLRPVHQRQAAVLALWRWRAPMLAFGLDAEWGVDQSVLESLFRLAAAPAGEESDRAYRREIAELCLAPLFTSEVDPDPVQLFQLETISNLLTFGELLDKRGVDEVERVVEASAGLANYLDGLVEGSFYSHPSEDAHRQYLADLADGRARAISRRATSLSRPSVMVLSGFSPIPQGCSTRPRVASCSRSARTSAKSLSQRCSGSA